jgi:hypothetical protein
MYMKKISIAFLSALLVIGGTGCLKDEGFDNNEYGIKHPEDSPVGVGFPQASNKINVTSIENVTTTQTFQVALVNLLSDEPAEQDIHVTLVADPSVVAAYNAVDENRDGIPDNPQLAVMPTNAYSIPSMVVTIPKGSRTATLPLTINNAKTNLDITKTYGFGFRIASVQEGGVTIASNLNKILVGIAIKNQWDGHYEINGYHIRGGDPSLTGPVHVERDLVTAGATTVAWEGSVPWGGPSQLPAGYEPIITVNESTNKVTVTSANGLVTQDNTYDNRWDPATKTFYIRWLYPAGAQRLFTDTLKYLRPR